MNTKVAAQVEVPSDLIEAIRSFPLEREVDHCGERFAVSPFDIYATCPRCRQQIKVRSFAAVSELEDVFDAVFEWLLRPGAAELLKQRQQALAEDQD